MSDLSVDLCGIPFRNPSILSSGILGTSPEVLKLAEKSGAGAVTTKSIGLQKREGHPGPILTEVAGGFLNAVGLSNPGLEKGTEKVREAKKLIEVPLIASIFAFSLSDFEKVAKGICEASPDFIEVNISCPNVESEHGKPFSTDPVMAAEAAKIVKESVNVPVIVKLSPNVADIKEIAKAVEKHCDCISAINTAGPGMSIDVETRMPILSNKAGGLSGPAIKPIAVRCVYEISRAVKVPVVGIGGITTGEDAVEMMMAGASAFGIGTGVYYRGVGVFSKVNSELGGFLRSHGIKSVRELTGSAK